MFLATTGLFLTACQPAAPQEKEQPPLKEVLPGTWEAVSISVKVNSAMNTDSSYVFDVPEELWVQKLGVLPVKTFYEADNKYRQVYTSLTNEELSTTRGIWNTFSDTLMMIEENTTYQYVVSLPGNGLAEFRTQLDWDGDGKADDDYLGIIRQISKYAN